MIQFQGRKYTKDADIYAIYTKVEKAFADEGVTFLHVRDQMWLTAPDETTKRAAIAFFKRLEAQLAERREEAEEAEWAAADKARREAAARKERGIV